uniref:Uncharacterized protein n=1 Tax=Anguilla anguilla TaxID=7936 RepID=A0A0E9XIP9_ANGAN
MLRRQKRKLTASQTKTKKRTASSQTEKAANL